MLESQLVSEYDQFHTFNVDFFGIDDSYVKQVIYKVLLAIFPLAALELWCRDHISSLADLNDLLYRL